MPVLVMLAELSAPCTVIISMVRTMVMVCTSGSVPVVVRSYRVLKELPFCSAVTCNNHDQRFTDVRVCMILQCCSDLPLMQLRSFVPAHPRKLNHA